MRPEGQGAEAMAQQDGRGRRLGGDGFLWAQATCHIHPRHVQLLSSEMLTRHLNTTLGNGHVIRQGITEGIPAMSPRRSSQAKSSASLLIPSCTSSISRLLAVCPCAKL